MSESFLCIQSLTHFISLHGFLLVEKSRKKQHLRKKRIYPLEREFHSSFTHTRWGQHEESVRNGAGGVKAQRARWLWARRGQAVSTGDRDMWTNTQRWADRSVSKITCTVPALVYSDRKSFLQSSFKVGFNIGSQQVTWLKTYHRLKQYLYL